MASTARKMNKQVLEQVKPETSLETKNDKTIDKSGLLWEHSEKAGFFENYNNPGKIEGNKKKGRPNMRWIHSMKEAIGGSPQELDWAVEGRTFCTSLIHMVTRI